MYVFPSSWMKRYWTGWLMKLLKMRLSIQADAFEERICTTTDQHYTPVAAAGSPARSKPSSKPGQGSILRSPPIAWVKLHVPKLTIHTFIYSSPELSQIGKFKYLRSLMEKSAAEAISGLTLTNNHNERMLMLFRQQTTNDNQAHRHALEFRSCIITT